MCPFFTYLYFQEGFCLQVVILEKVTNFDTLKKVVFGKASRLYFKTLQQFVLGTWRKREISGLFLNYTSHYNFLSQIFQINVFSVEWSTEIHKSGMNFRRMSPYLCERVKFSIMFVFFSLNMDFCPSVFDITIVGTLQGSLRLLRGQGG